MAYTALYAYDQGIILEAGDQLSEDLLAPEVARAVMATGADMIVIGSRAMGWLGDDITPGAAEAVIHRTHRPVVVAPSRRRS